MTNLPANWTAPNQLSPPRRRNSFRPILIAVACTFLLLVASLDGYSSTCGNWPNSGPLPSNGFYGRCVLFSLAVFLASLAWLVLSFFIWLIKTLISMGKG